VTFARIQKIFIQANVFRANLFQGKSLTSKWFPDKCIYVQIYLRANVTAGKNLPGKCHRSTELKIERYGKNFWL
jgi:hypothetical protein